MSAFENFLKSTEGNSVIYRWSADLVVQYQEAFMPSHALTQAWQEVSFSTIAGVLDTIRTRALNVALDLKTEIGESDADLKKIEPNSTNADKVNQIVINHIYGGTVFVGDQQTINTQSIAVGNWQDLEKALLTIGIKEAEVGDLSQAIEADGRTFGSRVKDWISKNSAKVFDKGLQVGVSVGTNVLTEYIKRHLG